MKERLVSALQVVFALLMLGLMGWGVYLLASAVTAGLASLESDLAIALVAASGTVVVSVLSLIISKRLEARAAVLQELRERKVPIYESIIKTLFKIHYSEKLGQNPPSQEELMQFFVTVTEQLVIWGSDEVVREFRAFRMHFVGGGQGIAALFKYENLLSALRKDLGHKNRGFKRGTLLGLWVNDIDQYLK